MGVGGRVELGAEEVALRRYRLRSRAYHRCHETPKSQPSEAGRENVRRSREKRVAYLASAPDPSHEDGRERQQRIERLVREGMARRFAEADVYIPAPLAKPANPTPKMPPRVEGVYVHGPECDCWWCDEGEACESGAGAEGAA